MKHAYRDYHRAKNRDRRLKGRRLLWAFLIGAFLGTLVAGSLYVKAVASSGGVPEPPRSVELLRDWKPIRVALVDEGLFFAVYPRSPDLVSIYVKPYLQFTLSRAVISFVIVLIGVGLVLLLGTWLSRSHRSKQRS